MCLGTAQFNDHFLFSVRDAAVAEEIMKYNGKKSFGSLPSGC